MRLTAVLRTGDERDESPASERNEAFDRRRSLRHDRIEIMLPDKGPVQLAERIAQTVHPFGASRPHLPRVVAGHSRTRSFAVCIAH